MWERRKLMPNKPIRFVDSNGEYPRQLFDTMDDAARDSAYYINARSIRENVEYATAYYIKTHFTVTQYRYKRIMDL